MSLGTTAHFQLMHTPDPISPHFQLMQTQSLRPSQRDLLVSLVLRVLLVELLHGLEQVLGGRGGGREGHVTRIQGTIAVLMKLQETTAILKMKPPI